MRKFTFPLLFFLVFVRFAAAQCSEGFNQTFAILNFGSGNVYYNLQSTSPNYNFEDANLGSFCPNATFLFEGGQNQVYKCNGADIWECDIWYRIYPTSGSGGSFNQVQQYYQSGSGNGCGGADQTWEANGSNINLLSGLSAGTYYLEVYSTAYYQYCGSGTIYASNGGYNYRATFTVLPTPSVSVNSPKVCAGDTATITATGGTSYVWNTAATAASITTTIAGTYTVTATNAAGCTATANGIVTLHSNPTAHAGHNDTVDINTGAVLGDTSLPIGGTPPYTFRWSPPNGLSDTIIPNPIATPIITTNYALVVTDSNGCVGRDTVQVYYDGKADAFTEITYTAENMQFSDSGGQMYVDFDVFASDTPAGLLYSQGIIFIQYDTLIFGKSIVDSGKIVASKGQAIDSPYYNLTLADSTPSMLKISITHNTGAVSLTSLNNVNQQLCHLRVNISAFNLNGVTAAYDSIAMAGLSKYQRTLSGIEFPYDIVRVSGLEAAQGASGYGIQYRIDTSSILLWPNPTNPTQVWFNIQAEEFGGNGTGPIWAASQIAVDYGSAFFSNIVDAGYITVTPIGAAASTDIYGDTLYNFSINDNPDNNNEFVINIINSFNESNGVAIFQNSFEDLAHVVMQISNCSNPLNISLDTAAMANLNNSYFDVNNSDLYSTTQYDPIEAVDPPSNLVNAHCTSTCTGNVNMAFSFSDYSVIYDSVGAEGGRLQFSVNFSPVSDAFATGYLFSTKAVIDYNAGIGSPFASWRDFQVTANSLLVSNHFTLIDTILNGRFLVTIQAAAVDSGLLFNFGQDPTPLFTLTMPFDNTDNSCDVICEVAFDSVMDSNVDSNEVLTDYETGEALTPTPVCSQQAVPNNDLYNRKLCPPPVVSEITATAGCYTAGSFDEVSITGDNFLNGYTPIPGDTTTYPKIFFNNADEGCCSSLTIYTTPQDILSCSQTQLVVLIPGSRPNREPAGSGLVTVQNPAGSASTSNSITINYANENDTTIGGNALLLYHDTTTLNKVFYLDQYLRTNVDVIADITNAIADLNCYVGTSFSLDTSLNSYTHEGGHNLIYLSHDPFYLSSGSAMHAHPYYNRSFQCYKNPSTIQSESNPYGNYIEPLGECDVAVGDDGTLNPAQDTNFLPLYGTQVATWQYSATAPAVGIQYDFMTFILHELGHCGLLAHSTALNTNDASSRVMYASRGPLPFRLQSFNGDADDIAGVVNTFQRAKYIASTGGSCNDIPASINVACSVDTINCGIGLINSISNPVNNDNNAYFEVNLYPNPSENNVIIHIDASMQNNFEIKIFNLIGQHAMELKTEGGPVLDIPCNTSDLASGIYLVEVKTLAPLSMEKALKFIKL